MCFPILYLLLLGSRNGYMLFFFIWFGSGSWCDFLAVVTFVHEVECMWKQISG
ncbi:hypothetical protein HanRHA438_Chr07g0310791 [Helianthus annuus]|nr:hypothetical protein HanRHA438_Chr07g0310791 [Helianthus annuus]